MITFLKKLISQKRLTLIVRNKRMEYLAEFAYRNVDMVTVLSPESLIGYIAEKIEKMQKKYL